MQGACVQIMGLLERRDNQITAFVYLGPAGNGEAGTLLVLMYPLSRCMNMSACLPFGVVVMSVDALYPKSSCEERGKRIRFRCFPGPGDFLETAMQTEEDHRCENELDRSGRNRVN